jgi:hypothetical protein
MALIHNDVFDAALTEVATANKAEVRTAASAVLVGSITLDASNYGAIGDNSGSGGGRKRQCLVSSTSDMKNISVTNASGGSATKVALVDAGSADLIVASISSAPKALGASDQVNLSTFSVILKDPS